MTHQHILFELNNHIYNKNKIINNIININTYLLIYSNIPNGHNKTNSTG